MGYFSKKPEKWPFLGPFWDFCLGGQPEAGQSPKSQKFSKSEKLDFPENFFFEKILKIHHAALG